VYAALAHPGAAPARAASAPIARTDTAGPGNGD